MRRPLDRNVKLRAKLEFFTKVLKTQVMLGSLERCYWLDNDGGCGFPLRTKARGTPKLVVCYDVGLVIKDIALGAKLRGF